MNNPRRTLDPGMRRNLLIIGAVLCAALLALFVVVLTRMQSSPAKGAPAVAVALPTSNASGQKKEGPPSPVLQQLVREQQAVEADAATRAGRPYIPPDSAGTEPVPAQQRALPPAPGAQTVTLVAGQAPQQGPSQEELARRERIRRGMEAQLRDLMATAAPPQNVVRVRGVAEEATQQTQTASRSLQREQAATLAEPQPTTATVVDALEIFAATTLTPVDTYKTGYFSARIVSGKLAGALLTGRTQVVNEGLQPRFTQMRWNGRTFAVDAIALDEQAGTDAVDANLDRRYLQRYVMPVVVAMMGGYTEAKAQTGTSVVSLGAGTTGSATLGVSQPAPTEQQAINAGISRAMSITQRAVDQEAARPIRATLPAGTAIGVLFNAPVVDADASRAANLDAARQSNAERSRIEGAAQAPIASRVTVPSTQMAQPSQPIGSGVLSTSTPMFNPTRVDAGGKGGQPPPPEGGGLRVVRPESPG